MFRKTVIATALLRARAKVADEPADGVLEYLVRQLERTRHDDGLVQPPSGDFTEDQVKAIAIAYADLQVMDGGPG